ncbi:IS21-like element helper ATPase IstB [Desulfuribacillus alkaliarsenatis]|uniref:AAA family ATPase n=1 Tax=Desulfuribacillus alkaliarsenatis TaxID=766136 RepID=A0A1E5G2K6_9FIRM|nr:IS21-like element helper ATPase IstB [Desulfuribacillus alkaliarsenatis]OEF97216.1 AAA family ATPase [Desulfuribacillus alkaliarsenatis]
MINPATVTKLHEMRLSAMAETFIKQTSSQEYQDLSFEERFGLIVDMEWARRKNNKLLSLIRKAEFRYPQASIEDIEYHADRKLDKGQILRLSTCAYIEEKRNLIIMGASGSGKSYIACAYGMTACRHYYPVKYIRLPDLLDELAVARGEGNFKKIMKQYKKVSLLIIDEWLLTPLKETQAMDLLEIVESRHQNASTIYCSQFAPDGWHEKIGEDTLADAILDRIVHDSYKILIDGAISMRERNGINT